MTLTLTFGKQFASGENVSAGRAVAGSRSTANR